jgi:gluconate 2-dehydrogenase gamma chain
MLDHSPLLPLLGHLGQTTRRRFLGLTALGVLSARRGFGAASALTAAETRTLEAATSRILPSDDGPGAREARVMRFIDAQLAGPLSPLLPAMQQGALMLDRYSELRNRALFADATAEQQDLILGELSRGAIPVRSFPQAEWFAALHDLTLEGFLSDPAHGGNAGEIGWRAIGFPTPHLRKPGAAPHHHTPVR